MYSIDVDNSDIKAYSEHLKKMHRSNFPIVVRQTLNDMAFDVKKNTLLPSADKEFILRNPSFFKKHSGVKKAVGFDVGSMKSEVGIKPNNSTAAKQLTQQELGGRISNRSMIYMDQARVSKSKHKKVRKANYIGTKRIVTGNPNRKRSDKSQFIADAIKAKENNLQLLTDNTLFDVKSIRFRKGKNRKPKIKLMPIADFEKGRSVNLKARPFLKPASIISYKKANAFFIANAEKRFKTGRK